MSLVNAIRNRFRSMGPSQIDVGVLLRSYWRLGAAALGISIAALGQIVIMSERVLDYPVLTPLADAVLDVFTNPTTVLVGLILLVGGGVLFATTISSELQTDDSEGNCFGPETLTTRLPRSRFFLWMLLLAAVVNGYLWYQLATGNYEGTYPVLFFVGIALVGGALFYLDRESRIDLIVRIGALEVAFLVAVTAAFIAINLIDLNSWYYSTDVTYVVFNFARSIAEGAPFNFFSQWGPRPWDAAMQYYYVAGVMKVFGVDYFGWKLASTLAGAAIFVPLYFLVRTLFNVRIAIAAAALLVAAHVLLAYAHYGWLTIGSIVPSVLAFALFFAGVKRGSALLIFGAGVAAGLGFYVVMMARLTVPVLLLFMLLLLLLRYRVHLRHNLAFLFLGLALTVTPLLIVSNTDIITETSNESLFNYRNPDLVPDVWDRIKDNLVVNTSAFNYSQGAYKSREIYTSGSLLEPITAVLAVLGLAYAVKRFRTPRTLFLLTWLAVSIVALGINSPHPGIVIGRLSYTIPMMVIFAAIPLGATYALFRRSFGNNTFTTVAPLLLLSIILIAVLGSNLYRFWEVTPENKPANGGALVMKAALSSECRDSDRQTVVVAPTAGGTTLWALTARDWGNDLTPVMLAYEEMGRVREFSPTSCVIYQPTTEPPSEENLTRLQRLTGAQQVISEYDQTGLRRVMVLR